MPGLPIALGSSDFLQIREEGTLYVDKSAFILRVLKPGPIVQLYPRPRRFGKTLAMSVLQHFVELGPDKSRYFQDLAVWRDDHTRSHFQSYAVISLSFKEIKPQSWEEMRSMLEKALDAEILRLRSYWIQAEAELVTRLRNAVPDAATFRLLFAALHQVTGRRVLLLIDEYDAPLLHAWTSGYYDECAAWFRIFLTSALKDNVHLHRGVLTGVLRVAKESMFSGLNNVQVYSLLQADEPEPFGFSQEEVDQLLQQYGRETDRDPIRDWYNGYRFGDTTVYNPWSLLSALEKPKARLRPYWLNSSENLIIHQLLLENPDLHPQMRTLFGGGSIAAPVDESVPLRALHGANIWSMLLFAGYLTALKVDWEDEQGQELRQPLCTMAIPNKEVSLIWQEVFETWLRHRQASLEPLHRAILQGDAPALQEQLQALLLEFTSSHDLGKRQVEAFFHAFMLGLLVTMDRRYRVLSNPETGHGRADVLVIPRQPGQAGAVLEFKTCEAGKLEEAAVRALAQIAEKQYTTALLSAGANPIQKFGIAVAGKEVVVRAG